MPRQHRMSFQDTAARRCKTCSPKRAKLDAFGAKLTPILQDMDIGAKPAVFDICNILEGE